MLAELARPLHMRTPDDHALVLHPTGRGRVTIARHFGADSWHEASVPVPDLSYVTRQLQGETDVYLTQNRFFSRRRLVAHLAELDAFFTDLDYYRTPLADADPRHVLDLALETLALHRMPEPTFALATGRGLALIWLHSPVPRAALPRWRACQKAIHDALRHLGADRLATDAARVLRLVGTRNSRSGSLVEAITPVGEVWNFDMLADEILPIPRAELVALRLERAARRARGKGVPRPSCYFTATSLWELRLAELQQLREHRWLGSLPSGQRDLWLLLAAAAISYLVPAQMVRREVYALADQVTGGAWSEREAAARMSAVIARAERAAYGHKIEYGGKLIDPRYRFKTETIIELLAITETEMRACGFRHLASSEIQRELERQRWHERRTAAGGLSRAEYLENSLTQRKPWENEGISRRTYYRRQGGTGPSGCMVGMPSEGTSPVCRG